MLTVGNEEDIRLHGLLSQRLFCATRLGTKVCGEQLSLPHSAEPSVSFVSFLAL